MRIKFQADADLDGRVIRGLRRIAPEIDMRTSAEARLAGLDDPDVLRSSAADARILVSQDRSTMPAHFRRFIAESESAGVILVRSAVPIGVVIEELPLIWAASEPEEWTNRLVWIPL